MIYLDSSALLKLVFSETESNALRSWLGSTPGHWVSSELTRVEMARAVRRADPTSMPQARLLLAELDFVPLVARVLDQAAEMGVDALRSLDALHLASALVLRDQLTAVVAYDLRLLTAAEDIGLPVASPR